jgi:hypothetical protein
MTPSQTASAIRNNLKDYNNFPGSTTSSPLTISTVKGPITPVKQVSIDAINRKAAYVSVNAVTDPITLVTTTTTISTPYTVPVQSVVSENPTTVFNGFIASAAASVASAATAYAADNATLPALEMASEKLEFLTQLFSAFKALSNLALVKVTAVGETSYSYILSGESGTGLDLTTIFAETLITV